MNATTMPAMATTPPTSKSRNGPNPNGVTIGRQARVTTPMASRMRSSVGPTPEEGHLEDAADVGGEVDLGGDEQVGGEDAERDERRHEAGGAETAEEHGGAGQVDDVVDVEAEAGPLLLADAGERAVEAVAEPVEGERQDDADQADHPVLRRPEAQAGAGHRRQAQAAQVIRRHPAAAAAGPCG